MKQKKIPFFFKSILWSYDFSRLDLEKDLRAIVVQTINYGTWRHWQWIAKRYGKSEVRRIIRLTPASEFRSSVLKLAMILFGIEKMKYASRGAYLRSQKTLAKI